MRISVSNQIARKLEALTCEHYSKLMLAFIADEANLQSVKLKRHQMQTYARLRISGECLAKLVTVAEKLKLRPEYLASYVVSKMLSANGLESYWQIALQEQLGGRREVAVPCGYIDLLTNDRLIEVKQFAGWKGAIGQALCYQLYWPKHKPCVALFGTCSKAKMQVVEHCASKLGVEIMYLEG